MYIYNYYSQLISNKSLHHSVVRYTDTGDDVIYVYIQQVPLSPKKKQMSIKSLLLIYEKISLNFDLHFFVFLCLWV